jgi:hypothetical protein
MKSKFVVITLMGILLVAGGVYAFQTNIFSISKNTVTPPLFQPEGQMLSQATLAENTDTVSNNQPKGNVPDRPTTATGDLATYKYNTKVCVNGESPYLCFASHYKDTVKNYGATIAIADIKTRSNQNQSALSLCHPLMHVIGRTAADSYKTASEAFVHGDSFCWSGYHHGIMEGLIAKIGFETLAKQLDSICVSIPGKENYSFDYYNCVHGLGHGIMAQLEDEIFDSLAMCDNLTGWWEQQSCYGGVYMQNIIDSTNVTDTLGVVKYLKPDEPMYPCTAVADKYKSQCYLGQTSYALQQNGYNYQKVFALCAEAPEPYRSICNQSMGRDIANQAGHQKEGTKAGCAGAPAPEDVTNCIIGAAKEIISYYHSDTESLAFCAILDESDKNTCVNTTHSYYSYF